MFGRRLKIFKLLGFTVYVDASWIFIALLVTWSLAMGLFPMLVEGLSVGTYWVMGVVGALGLFLSIVIHEFSHSLVARYYGLEMKGITLFLFGGVAEMENEPETPKVEFLMAIAGPIASILLAGLFYAASVLGTGMGWPETLLAILTYLALINGIVAIFNMVPAFPLDGGRVLRSGLWGWKRDIRWATRIAAGFGMAFGTFLMVMGVLAIFQGALGGFWWILIGMFIIGASRMSRDQLNLRLGLGGEKVERFMTKNPVTVSPGITVDELVENYIYRYHYKMFPVVEGDRLEACVTSKQVKDLPREAWSQKTVRDIATTCNPDNTVSPQTDAMEALQRMNRTQSSRLLVVQGDELVGIIALKDMVEFMTLKSELEG